MAPNASVDELDIPSASPPKMVSIATKNFAGLMFNNRNDDDWNTLHSETLIATTSILQVPGNESKVPLRDMRTGVEKTMNILLGTIVSSSK